MSTPDLSIVSDDDLSNELLARCTAGVMALAKDGYEGPDSRQTTVRYRGSMLEVIGLSGFVFFETCRVMRKNRGQD